MFLCVLSLAGNSSHLRVDLVREFRISGRRLKWTGATKIPQIVCLVVQIRMVAESSTVLRIGHSVGTVPLLIAENL